MTEKRQIPAREEEVPVDVLCDGCGQSVVKHRDGDDLFTEKATLSASWGFHSRNRDGDHGHFEICEACFDKVIEVLGLRGEA